MRGRGVKASPSQGNTGPQRAAKIPGEQHPVAVSPFQGAATAWTFSLVLSTRHC